MSQDALIGQDLAESEGWPETRRNREEQFHALADLLPELCWMARADGHIFWYNQTWYDYTGTTPEQMSGWGWQTVHDPDILPSVMEQWQASLQSGRPFEKEFPLRGADGVFRWFLTRVRPVCNREGRIVQWFGTNANIDEHVRMRQSLLEAQQALETRVQERTSELNAANRNLRQLSARLLQLRDEERRRLARELHDSVGQMLAAIKMNIDVEQASRLDPDALRAVTDNARLIDEVSSEIRTISHLLHPPLLDEVGLSSALQCYVEGFSERSKVAVTLDIAADLARLDHEMEISIFRIVQESLTNVHRHSESRDAIVRIAHEDGQIEVEIRDTGKGIPPEIQKALGSAGSLGVGFRGMRERLTQLGGQLEIRSNPGCTSVIGKFPVRRVETAA